MKNYKPKIIAALVFFLGILKVQAQQATVASGGNASGAGGKVSYSIGQVAYQAQTGTNGNVNQGVQQAFEIFTLSGEEFANIKLEAMVYPNPTTSIVTLKISNLSLNDLNYQFFDIQGRLIKTGTITDVETVLDIQQYPTATYLLKVNLNNKELKIFKIIKN